MWKIAKRESRWESQIDGKHYEFVYRQKWFSKNMLTVNGTPITRTTEFTREIVDFFRANNEDKIDAEFMLDGKKARVVVQFDRLGRGTPDVIVNNISTRNGVPLEPCVPRPPWGWIFCFLHMLMFSFNEGLLSAFLVASGTGLCIYISKTSWATENKVLLCIAITAVSWVLLFRFADSFPFSTLLQYTEQNIYPHPKGAHP